MRVLIVDDSASARMFIRRCVEIAGLRGAEFAEAANGEEALGILKAHGADLVLTDLTMPGMDGETLLKRMRASPSLHEIPVVVISSVSNPAKEKSLIEHGALAVVKKPPSPASLAPLFSALLQGGSAVGGEEKAPA